MIYSLIKKNKNEDIIVNFGDSQAEVIDYIFYNNKNYLKNDENIGWKSGWSLRGLNKLEHQNKLYSFLSNLSNEVKNVFIFLTFGSVDIEWNLSYKRYILNEYPDTENLIDELCYTFNKVVDTFLNIEKNIKKYRNIKINIIVCFPYVPLLIPRNYLIEFSNKTNTEYYDIIEHSERLKLWNLYCDKLTDILNKKKIDNIKIIDIRKNFIENGIENYMRNDKLDHHPDFIKTQKIIIDKLKQIKFLDLNNKPIKLKYKYWKKKKLYPHIRRPLP